MAALMSALESVWLPKLDDTDAKAYDRFINTAADGHFSQMCAWAKVASAGKPVVPRYFLARHRSRIVGAALILQPRILRTLAIPTAKIERGPICGSPTSFAEILKSLVRESHRHGIARLSVMPYWADEWKAPVETVLHDFGFADVQSPAGRHVRSLRVDLALLSNNELFGSSALAKVRRQIRRAERAGATVRRGGLQDFAAFRVLNERLLSRRGKRGPPSAWYRALADYFLADETRGAMFVCEHHGRIISATFVARLGKLATCAVGASSGDDIRFPKMLLPITEAIGWAKRNGLDVLDLGGIPMNSDTDPKRLAIGAFKRTFAGREISFAHEHIRWF
ncbi:MAG: GNAT family N-acetyltransferase [Alphaproteobacteria bacterium]|nr:GNAT family N-acetyltransferase [Alphaproteobacteria bacterium]MDE2495641.1 GNAT family N-acetyltransferase [Alphaproteobacteria bacterium]